MRSLLLASLLVGACGEGIFIEVRRPPGVAADRVELLVADELCSLDGNGDVPCDGIQPQGFTRKVGDAEHIYFRDALDPFVGEFGDSDTVVFQLSPGAEVLPLVIAVGSTENGVTSVAVMEDIIDLRRNPVRYEADLAPAEPLTETGAESGKRAAIAWPDTRDTLDCFGVAGPEGTFFLVPDEDHDCDRVAEPECDPLAYLGQGGDVGDARCVTHNPNVNGACTAGLLACTEDPAAPPGECVPEPYCVPDALCNQNVCEPFDTSCHSRLLGMIDPPRLKCTFRGEQLAGDLTQCKVSRPAVLDTGLDPTIVCPSQPLFVDLENAPDSPFDIATDTLAIGATKFKVVAHQAVPCSIELDFEGSAPAIAGPFQAKLALEMTFIGISGEERRLLIPATFEIQPNCDGPASCTLEAQGLQDGVFQCTE